jgi:hypothetical protein
VSERGREYAVVVEMHEKGGWEWSIIDTEYDNRTVTTWGGWADRYGIDHDALTGRTMTRWGARREANRALRKLLRYVNRPEPEVIPNA